MSESRRRKELFLQNLPERLEDLRLRINQVRQSLASLTQNSHHHLNVQHIAWVLQNLKEELQVVNELPDDEPEAPEVAEPEPEKTKPKRKKRAKRTPRRIPNPETQEAEAD